MSSKTDTQLRPMLDAVVLDEDASAVQIDQDRFALAKAQRLEFLARDVHGHEFVRGEPKIEFHVRPQIDDALDAANRPLWLARARLFHRLTLDADVMWPYHCAYLSALGNMAGQAQRRGSDLGATFLNLAAQDVGRAHERRHERCCRG